MHLVDHMCPHHTATYLHTHVYVNTVLHMYPTLYPDSGLRRPFAGTGHKKPLADYVA